MFTCGRETSAWTGRHIRCAPVMTSTSPDLGRPSKNGEVSVSSSLADSLNATQNRCFDERHGGCGSSAACVCGEAPAPPCLMTHSRTCAAAPCTAFLCVREILLSSTRGFASLIQIHNSKGHFGEFAAASSVLRSRSRAFEKALNAS